MPLIKICGITNKVDAMAASDLGVDMIGFIFYKKSKRYVEPAAAREIIDALPPHINRVGVFVNEKREHVLEIAEDTLIDTLQFHGDETPEYCRSFKDGFKVIKAFRIKNKKDLRNVNEYDVDFYLLDTYKPGSMGGTGQVFDWEMVEDFEFLRPVFLSGGLTPDNVERAIREVAPYGVDVATGVETAPGKKDMELMKKFIDNVRKA